MYKSKLQELCHQRQWSLPKYSCMKDGPDHNPNFTASVRVNGVSFDSSISAISSKEAQNDAAKLAFLHFTSPSPVSDNASAELDSGEQMGNKCNVGMDSHPIPNVSGDLQHQYKNQLQNYCQFYDLPLPAYSVFSEGPSHACFFRATVAVNGVDFKSSTFFKTLKEAENAAARAALMSLSPNGIEKTSTGYYKSQLQELVQRVWFSVPSYKTTKSGVLHMQMFYSTVEIKGEVFQGEAARSKKQAEINAAMVALTAFENRKLRRSGESKETASPEVIASEFESFVQPTNPNSALKKLSSVGSLISSSTSIQQPAKESKFSLCGESKQPASPNDNDSEFKTSPQSINPFSTLKEPCSKGSLVSSPTETQQLAEKIPPSKTIDTAFSADQTCHKLSALSIADAKSDTMSQKSKSYLLGNKVRVYPYIPNITSLPEGVTVLPVSDDAWVAVSLEFPNETSV